MWQEASATRRHKAASVGRLKQRAARESTAALETAADRTDRYANLTPVEPTTPPAPKPVPSWKLPNPSTACLLAAR
jgi:hypothetical protein